MIRRLRTLRLGRGEAGYSLTELLVVMTIMGVVMTGLTTVFVAASQAELDMNDRFQAQLNARVALDKLRRDIHCATSASPAGATDTIVLVMPAGCPGSGGVETSLTWCAKPTVGGASGTFRLLRVPGALCAPGLGIQFADSLTIGTAFSYTAQSTSSLASIAVDLKVSIKGSETIGSYELTDTIFLRNSSRT